MIKEIIPRKDGVNETNIASSKQRKKLVYVVSTELSWSLKYLRANRASLKGYKTDFVSVFSVVIKCDFF